MQKCKTQEQISSLNLSVFLIFPVTTDTLFFLTVTEFGYDPHSSLYNDSREFRKQFHCSSLFGAIIQPFLNEHGR